MPQVKIFDRSNFDAITWPETQDAAYARKYLTPFVVGEPSHYVRNVHTNVSVLAVDDLRIPITVNDGEYDNSWVCSPHCQYVSYGRKELIQLENPALRWGLEPALVGLSAMMRLSSANRVVAVNNWLLSTNTYPPLDEGQVRAITRALLERYPTHAIEFRSVPDFRDDGLYTALKNAGYAFVTGRQIWINDYRSSPISRTRSVVSDLSLFKKTKYKLLEAGQIRDEHLPRLVTLYNKLYLEKYPDLNPQFTVDFIRLTLRERLFTYRALERDGQIDGFYAYFIKNGLLTCPLLGYDTGLPRSLGLYRMLCLHYMLEAAELKIILHGSAGAGDFKRNRGAVPKIEYNALYTKHLSARRSFAWNALAKLSERIGKPLLERYEF